MKSTKVLQGFVFLVFLVACGMPAIGGAQDKVIRLRFGNNMPVNHPLSKSYDAYCKEVEKRTNGRVQIKHYGGGTITKPTTAYESVINGVVDIAHFLTGYTKGRFPLSEIFYYPLGFPSGSMVIYMENAFLDKFKPKEFDDVKVLFAHGQTPAILHTNQKPVRKMEDLEGMKIRLMGPNVALYQALGATPVAMPLGETYDALARHVVDGTVGPYDVLFSFKLGEVLKYTTETTSITFSSFICIGMNKAKWNSIPPDLQKIMDQVSKEWIVEIANTWEKMQETGRDYARKKGVEVIELSSDEKARWTAKAEPVIQGYVKELEAKGLPGVEAVQFVREYIKTHTK